MEVQIGHQLDNTLDYKLNYLKDNQLDIENWTLESFNHKNITSINQIDFDITNSVEIRNNVLSYWYNCFSDIQLKKSILLFLDENYFNILTRILRGISTNKIKKANHENTNPDSLSTNALFVVGNNILTELFNYRVDINIGNLSNIKSFDVYINEDYYGSDLSVIQINTGDRLRIEVVKYDDTKEGIIELNSVLL
jgi:hypothetical protein